MPIVDAGFAKPDGTPDHQLLFQFGPTAQVTVGHFAPDSDAPAQAPTKTVLALIDTGACQSCIDTDLAKELQLPVIDTQKIAGASGASDHDVFLAHIGISALEFVQYGRFTGVNLKAGGQQHEVLLGRTFLQNCILIYDGLRGQVTIASARVK